MRNLIRRIEFRTVNQMLVAGMLSGAAEFFALFGAFAWALRNGLFSRSSWYDAPVTVLILFFVPVVYLCLCVRWAWANRDAAKRPWMPVLFVLLGVACFAWSCFLTYTVWGYCWTFWWSMHP